MHGVEIEIQGRDAASSSQAMQEIRQRAISRGVPPGQVALRGTNSEAMNVAGTVMSFDIPTIAMASTAILAQVATVAMAVYEIAFREKPPTIRIKTAKGDFVIKSGELEVDTLTRIISEGLNVDAQQQQQQQ